MFEADQLQKLLNAADGQLHAMLLLGINCGFGNNDVATLPMTAIDLEKGWVNYPWPKTGIKRRCQLWAETVAALAAAVLDRRPRGLLNYFRWRIEWDWNLSRGATE